MFLGLALILGALLWARDIRRNPLKAGKGYRGPWIMGGVGAAVIAGIAHLVRKRRDRN